MIILDTNVLSEGARPTPAPQVLDWLATRLPSTLFITTVSEAELLYGLALLPVGRRRSCLEEATRRMFAEDFEGRILPFDRVAASAYAAIRADRRRIGRPIAAFDAQIAAIARAYGAAVATRNAADFVDCGIDVVDPWQA